MTVTRTYTGRDVDLRNPAVAQISIRDIAHQLATINRFNGAPALPYSVAQHSTVVVRIVEQMHVNPRLALMALLHDAHEIYTGDAPTPTQEAMPYGRAELKLVQHQLDRTIYEALGLSLPVKGEVDTIRFADRKAFSTEWRAMMPGQCPPGYPEPATFNIKPIPWHAAEEKFLKEYERLSMLAGVHPPKIPNLPTGINK